MWETSGTALCMPSGEGMWLSRMRENLTSGSLGERWKRSGGPRRRIEPPTGNRRDRGPGGPQTRHAPWQPGLWVIPATAPALYPTAEDAEILCGKLAAVGIVPPAVTDDLVDV